MCWATFTTILGHMGPTGCGLDSPAFYEPFLPFSHFQFQSFAELIIIPLMGFQSNCILYLVHFHLDWPCEPSLISLSQFCPMSAAQHKVWVSASSAYYSLLGRFKHMPLQGPNLGPLWENAWRRGQDTSVIKSRFPRAARVKSHWGRGIATLAGMLPFSSSENTVTVFIPCAHPVSAL